MIYWFISGLKDAYRAKSLLAANILVVSGICLPILLLLGLKRGLISQFRDDINKSPTARLITTIGANEKNQFTIDNSGKLRDQIASESGGIISGSAIALVIPDVSTAAVIKYQGQSEITLNSTLPGDPFLDFYGVDVIGKNDRGLVVSLPAAEKVGLPFSRNGEGKIELSGNIEVDLQLTNSYGGSGVIKLPILGIWEAPGSEQQIARASLQLMNWIEDFKKGRSVPELGLEGAQRLPSALFDGYLSFAKVPISEDDKQNLVRRGLTPVLLSESGLPNRDGMRSLFGLLTAGHDLSVYWIRATKGEEEELNFVNFAAKEVEEITYLDDVVLPWVKPSRFSADGRSFNVVPASVSARWLRASFVNYSQFREVDLDEAFAGLLLRKSGVETLKIQLSANSTFQLPVHGISSLNISSEVSPTELSVVDPKNSAKFPGERTQTRGAETLFVSSSLASYLSLFERKMVGFDEVLNTFVPLDEPNRYTRASIFVSDISDVPAVDSTLKSLNYLTSSSRTRVEEMLGHSRSLDMLILVIFSAVFLFGVFTLLSLFNDVTNRKRGTIGIMRLLGAGARQIFLFLFVRSLLVSVLSAGASYLVGLGIAEYLDSISVECILTISDLKIVALGAFCCCAIGVGLPAIWTIKRMEPVDAIANSSIN